MLCRAVLSLARGSETTALTIPISNCHITCQTVNSDTIRSMGAQVALTHDALALSSLWNARITAKYMGLYIACLPLQCRHVQ